MSEAISGLLAEMLRQRYWLALAHDRDCDALYLASGDQPMNGPWEKIENERGNFPGYSGVPSRSRIWTRMDLRRSGADEGTVIERPEGPGWVTRVWIFVHGRPTFNPDGKLEGPTGFLAGIDRFQARALAEAHSRYPAIAPLIVTASRIHARLLDNWADGKIRRVKRLLLSHTKIIERIREFLPDARQYGGSQVGRRKGGKAPPPACPKCNGGKLYVRSSRSKGPGITVRYRKCDKCIYRTSRTEVVEKQ